MGASNRLLMAAARARGLSPLILGRRGLSTAVSRSSPWLMLPSHEVADTYIPDSKLHSMDYSFYRLSEERTISLRNRTKGTNPMPRDAFCIGSSKGWLLYSDPADCALFLTNPLVTPSPPTVPLPPVSTLSSVNVVSGSSPNPKYYKIERLSGFPPEETHTRIILSFAISSGSPESEDCVIMVIQYSTHKVSFCKPAAAAALHNNNNTEEAAWINLDDVVDPTEYFYSIAYSSKEKLFYTLNSMICGMETCGVVTWDFRDDHLEPKREAYQPVFTDKANLEELDKIMSQSFTSEYLVESSGDILLVLWHSDYVDRDGNIVLDACEDLDNILPVKTLRFDVYKLSKEKDSWEHMKSLGDRVLFLGKNEPFSLSASDFPELKPNSIYFTGSCLYAATDWGIYNIEDGIITRHYPCSYWSKLRPPPIWIDRSSSAIGI